MQDKRRWLPRWRRVELAEKCELEGMSRRQAAAWRRVSPSTVQYWVDRRRAASPDELDCGSWAEDRPSTPKRQPRLSSPELHERVCEARPRTGWGPASDRLGALLGACDGLALPAGAGPVAAAQAGQGRGPPLRVAQPGRPAADGHQALPALHAPRPRSDRGSLPHRRREADARRPRVRALDHR
jgi:hypothetical protein